MQQDKTLAKIAATIGVGLVAIVVAVATATAAPANNTRRPPRNPPPPVESPEPEPPQPPGSTGDVDADFVSMMIPHHFQALVMSRMAPEQGGDDAVQAMAERIEVEQNLEIFMMQGWQEWNGHAPTDAEQAYQMMLGMPMMLEQMGMATPEEIEDLAASSGTDFDLLFLELMITHHEGALTMLDNVIINGSDFILEGWANDMQVTQTTQILQMQAMLDDLGG